MDMDAHGNAVTQVVVVGAGLGENRTHLKSKTHAHITIL